MIRCVLGVIAVRVLCDVRVVAGAALHRTFLIVGYGAFHASSPVFCAAAQPDSDRGSRCAASIPSGFESAGDDRQAIEALLRTYADAVTTKNQSLFETLLLNRSISFSAAGQIVHAHSPDVSTRNYDSFRAGVFDGPAFSQSFRDVHILQDGPLAEVSLVFVNRAADGDGWGWKTLQLLKVAGQWKIASDFYTGHAL